MNHGEDWCISFGGGRVDEALAGEVLHAISGNAIEAAVNAAEKMRQQRLEQRRMLELELDQARYEVKLAARRYEAVDPDNRFVSHRTRSSVERRFAKRSRKSKSVLRVSMTTRVRRYRIGSCW